MQQITKENVHQVVGLMREKHNEELQWSKNNSNDIGGLFGTFQKLMGDPEIFDGLEGHLMPLLEHSRLFWTESPTLEHDGRVFSTVRRKERSIEHAMKKFGDHLKDGKAVYIRSVTWQKPYEVFGQIVNGFVMTQYAVGWPAEINL